MDYSYILLGFYDPNSGEQVLDGNGKPVDGTYFTDNYWTFQSDTIKTIQINARWKKEDYIYDDKKRRLPYSGGDSEYVWDDNL